MEWLSKDHSSSPQIERIRNKIASALAQENNDPIQDMEDDEHIKKINNDINNNMNDGHVYDDETDKSSMDSEEKREIERAKSVRDSQIKLNIAKSSKSKPKKKKSKKRKKKQQSYDDELDDDDDDDVDPQNLEASEMAKQHSHYKIRIHMY